MRRTRRAVVAVLLAAVAAPTPPARAAAAPATIAVLDNFDTIAAWETRPADGVEMKLSSEPGPHGRALRVDFNFAKGGGYAVLHRPLAITMPARYRFHVSVRGACAPQDFEFKLIDASGDNVWWCNRKMFVYPENWTEVITRQRQISFAWGPAGGGELRQVAAIEFAITAGSGGRGTVWLDDLTLETLPPLPAVMPAPVASASSAARGAPAAAALDTLAATAWRSASGDRAPWFALDLGLLREFGGLVLDWEAGHAPRGYRVQLSDDGRAWRDTRVVAATNGGRDWIDLPDSEARRVRVQTTGTPSAGGVGLARITLEPLDWAATREVFARNVALGSRRGLYPRGVIGEQNYWTVVGVDADRAEGLLDESGALEIGKARWSIEPFLLLGDSLVTWSDVAASQSLDEDLPMPRVGWQGRGLTLDVEVFATGEPGTSSLRARYRVRNDRTAAVRGRLALAVRPFQVNPPQQFLNTPGGTARVDRIISEGSVVRVNGTQGLVTLTPGEAIGASTFDAGDVVADWLAHGSLPRTSQVEDGSGRASAALTYAFDLAPGYGMSVEILVPLHAAPTEAMRKAAAPFDSARAAAAAGWRERYDRVRIEIPAARDVERALKAQLGWILINRDSAGIQPGSRSYERSWIRDGALTCTALLRLGQADVVREFIEWFAPYQYVDGKVPCCVDWRGSDPVPEHDSHGEFIYLIAEYLRVTGDRALADRMWPHVSAAAAYLDTLRAQRRGPEWRTPQNAPYFGLLPPSISHEGYSAKPMHSYWDDLFALRGYKDAVFLARTLGHAEDVRRFAASRDTFARDLHASILAAQRAHHIAYVPGCADLGDFDATSTTIALDPVEAGAVIPPGALDATFDRYWDFFVKRRDGHEPWEAFTPYEMRTIGAFVRMGERARAAAALDWFMAQRKPAGWQQWPEVVRHDPRSPEFLGDLPHTWVGSDFVRSVLDMFAYEQERDSSLVLASGIPEKWLDNDHEVSIAGLRTAYGPLNYRMARDRGRITVQIDAGTRIPPGGIVVRPPIAPVAADRMPQASVSLDGKRLSGYPDSVRVTKLPATVVWLPAPPGPMKPPSK